MAATGPAVTRFCWSFRASQQTKPNVSSASPASRPTTDAERPSRGEPSRSEIRRDGEVANANPAAASSNAVTMSNVFHQSEPLRTRRKLPPNAGGSQPHTFTLVKMGRPDFRYFDHRQASSRSTRKIPGESSGQISSAECTSHSRMTNIEACRGVRSVERLTRPIDTFAAENEVSLRSVH